MESRTYALCVRRFFWGKSVHGLASGVALLLFYGKERSRKGRGSLWPGTAKLRNEMKSRCFQTFGIASLLTGLFFSSRYALSSGRTF